MAEVVNLNRARKATKRAAQAMQANANRLAYGRTGAEKTAAKAETARDRAKLDGLKRDP